jgi:hypothetical protein
MGSVDPVFALAAAVTVGAGLLVVIQRNPIYSAISMLACFLGLAVIYLRLEAPFLAAIHVLVYTGAILVLFLFVIMLLNLKPEELGVEYPLKVRGPDRGDVPGSVRAHRAAPVAGQAGAAAQELAAGRVRVGRAGRPRALRRLRAARSS